MKTRRFKLNHQENCIKHYPVMQVPVTMLLKKFDDLFNGTKNTGASRSTPYVQLRKLMQEWMKELNRWASLDLSIDEKDCGDEEGFGFGGWLKWINLALQQPNVIRHPSYKRLLMDQIAALINLIPSLFPSSSVDPGIRRTEFYLRFMTWLCDAFSSESSQGGPSSTATTLDKITDGPVICLSLMNVMTSADPTLKRLALQTLNLILVKNKNVKHLFQTDIKLVDSFTAASSRLQDESDIEVQMQLVQLIYRLLPRNGAELPSYIRRLGLPSTFSKIQAASFEADTRVFLNQLNSAKDGIETFPRSIQVSRIEYGEFGGHKLVSEYDSETVHHCWLDLSRSMIHVTFHLDPMQQVEIVLNYSSIPYFSSNANHVLLLLSRAIPELETSLATKAQGILDPERKRALVLECADAHDLSVILEHKNIQRRSRTFSTSQSNLSNKEEVEVVMEEEVDELADDSMPLPVKHHPGPDVPGKPKEIDPIFGVEGDKSISLRQASISTFLPPASIFGSRPPSSAHSLSPIGKGKEESSATKTYSKKTADSEAKSNANLAQIDSLDYFQPPKAPAEKLSGRGKSSAAKKTLPPAKPSTMVPSDSLADFDIPQASDPKKSSAGDRPIAATGKDDPKQSTSNQTKAEKKPAATKTAPAKHSKSTKSDGKKKPPARKSSPNVEEFTVNGATHDNGSAINNAGVNYDAQKTKKPVIAPTNVPEVLDHDFEAKKPPSDSSTHSNVKRSKNEEARQTKSALENSLKGKSEPSDNNDAPARKASLGCRQVSSMTISPKESVDGMSLSADRLDLTSDDDELELGLKAILRDSRRKRASASSSDEEAEDMKGYLRTRKASASSLPPMELSPYAPSGTSSNGHNSFSSYSDALSAPMSSPQMSPSAKGEDSIYEEDVSCQPYSSLPKTKAAGAKADETSFYFECLSDDFDQEDEAHDPALDTYYGSKERVKKPNAISGSDEEEDQYYEPHSNLKRKADDHAPSFSCTSFFHKIAKVLDAKWRDKASVIISCAKSAISMEVEEKRAALALATHRVAVMEAIVMPDVLKISANEGDPFKAFVASDYAAQLNKMVEKWN